jgi:glucosamine--fructose-6-phosphate aminotransferase (isomerizing)
MNDVAFDPDAALPGPPDPWQSTSMPSLRSGPPYHMTEMIQAEPGLARRLLVGLSEPQGRAALLAGAVREAAGGGRPVVLTGCGTSEHAALAGVEILRDALRSAGLSTATLRSAQAFELSLDPVRSGLVIGVSHEGGTPATNAALIASRDAGARTALITVTDRSPGAALVELVVPTDELDQGWCHVIGYLAPILAFTAIASHMLGAPVPADTAGALIAGGVAQTGAAEAIAARFADAARLLVVASGSDRPAGREFVLKVEEGSWLSSAYRDLETLLHGHLAAVDDTTALVLVLTDRDHRAERMKRALDLLRATAALDVRAAAILAEPLDGEVPAELTPAGRILVPDAPALPGPVAALVGSAAPLQLITERLARARRTNPDPIRRDDPRYRAAAEAAEH